MLAWLCVLATDALSLLKPAVDRLANKPLLWNGTGVHVVTVDTRSGPTHRMVGPWGWDTYVRNVGHGRVFVDLRTKVRLMRDWLQAAELAPDDIVVFVDGDIMFGGCALDDFRRRLEQILAATNTSMVFGAELQCNDYNGDCSTDYPDKFYSTVLKSFSLTKEKVGQCTINTDAKVGRCDPGISPSKCNSHREMKFVNSGFYAGRAAGVLYFLRKWMSAISDPPRGTKVFVNPSDQATALMLLEQYPENVTLDYGTVLVSNLYGLDWDKDPFWYWDKVWTSRAIHRSVCFFHPNGNLSQIATIEEIYKQTPKPQ